MTDAASSAAASSNSAIAATARPRLPLFTKLPLTVWFHLGDEAAPPSGHLLQRRVAHRHKLMQVSAGSSSTTPLGGERSGGKRGRGAPGKTPFVAAVQTNEQGHPLRMKLTVVEGFRLTEIAAWAQLHLGTGTRVVSDAVLSWRHRGGLRSSAGGGGQRKGRCRAPRVSMGEYDSGNIKNALRGTYHAIRPKYAQRYLSEFEYRFNRRFDL